DLAFQRRTTGRAVRGPKNDWGIERGSKTPFHLNLCASAHGRGSKPPLHLKLVRLRAREGGQVPPSPEFARLCAREGDKFPFQTICGPDCYPCWARSRASSLRGRRAVVLEAQRKIVFRPSTGVSGFRPSCCITRSRLGFRAEGWRE